MSVLLYSRDERAGHGSKRTINSVMEILKDNGLNTERLWSRISDVILKTIITIQPAVRKTLKACFKAEGDTSNELGSQCFEILGFDIFIDSKLKPWLLEVNHSPSFTCDSVLDKKIKEGLITDALRLVSLDPQKIQRFKKEQREKSKSRLFQTFNTNSTSSSSSNLGSSSKAHRSSPSPIPHQKSSTQSPSPSVEPSKESYIESSDTDNIASAAEVPVLESLGDEKEKNTGARALDTDTVNRLLSIYHQSYPESMLTQISNREEDRGLGGFERIFPPQDPKKLAQYLNTIEHVDEFFGDNLASKRRKE